MISLLSTFFNFLFSCVQLDCFVFVLASALVFSCISIIKSLVWSKS